MEDFEFEACILKIQKGDKDGLKEIYQSYVGLIYSVVYDMVRQRENAQDITSDFFIRLWDKADTYRFGGKHKAWMLTIARNMAIDFMRKSKWEQLAEELPESQEKTEDIAEQIVGNISFREAVALLKPTEQEVLDLKILGGFTFQEIAQILKKPMGTVTWLYRQGIKKLQRHHKVGQEVQES